MRVLSTPGSQAAAAVAAEPSDPPAEPSDSPAVKALAVLRGARRQPLFVTTVRRLQLPAELAMATPADLQEAQDINHLLKVQYMKLQTAMFRWAIRNKQVRDAKQNQTDIRRKKKTVGGARLRELLQLEAAVKAMFSDAQLRAIIHQHKNSGDKPRKFKAHWGEEDLRRVLQLRALGSDKVLDYIREQMKIPLPSLHTTRKRCAKTPELSEAYREMVQKGYDRRGRCPDCQRQLDTINGVIGADEGPPRSDGEPEPEPGEEEEAPLDPRLPQTVPRPARPRKRRRASAAAPSARKKVRAVPATHRDWPETSDSDAELSDPGIWGRVERSLNPVLGCGAPGGGGQPPDFRDSDYRLQNVRRAWR